MRYLLFMLVFACAEGKAISDAVPVPDIPAIAIAEEPCPTNFVNPDDQLLADVQLWSDRWETATGRCIEVEETGIPMLAWPLVYVDEVAKTIHSSDPEGTLNFVCGVTVVDLPTNQVLGIYISTESDKCTPAKTVGHEIGHMWGGIADHAEQGLMAPGNSVHQTPYLTENTLEWVCGAVDCPAFQPEKQQ